MTTILVVDDELDMRLLVRMVIELANGGLGSSQKRPTAPRPWWCGAT